MPVMRELQCRFLFLHARYAARVAFIDIFLACSVIYRAVWRGDAQRRRPPVYVTPDIPSCLLVLSLR